MPDLDELIDEARRQLTICDSCRYCEGYCATFPALERGGMTDGDVVFLADLCHDCQACLQACMYATPHEFAVGIPAALTAVRETGYGELVWPRALSRALDHPVITKMLALALGLILAVVAAIMHGSDLLAAHSGRGGFYVVLPAELLTGFFLGLSALVLALLTGGFVRFWHVARPARMSSISAGALLHALWAAAILKNLDGGGGGCFHPDPEEPSGQRRVLHQCLVYGLTAAFAATVAAAVEQHLLGRLPPYPFLSVPVLLGTVGGAAVIIGGAGLAVLRWRAGQPATQSYVLIASLELVAITGILLLALRSSAAMPALLLVHLAVVTGLFLSLPFGKFVHAVHRFGALTLDAAEKGSLRRVSERRS